MAGASTQTPTPHLAALSDLLAVAPEGRFHEVLDGELVRKAAPSAEHGLGQAASAAWLWSYFGRKPNGAERPGGWWFLTEATIELARHDIIQPDVAGWRRERMPEAPTGYPLRLPPDWVCEVMTDADARRRDGLQKRRLYGNHGISHYWLLDVQLQTLTVLRLEASGYVQVLEAPRTARVRAEPFAAIELPVGVLFGEDAD